MESLKVEIVGKKIIKPSVPTPNHLQDFHLSLLDQMAPPMYVHILFYFLPDHQHFRKPQMEKSLSEALTRFYPLAGRFLKQDHSIQCADQGVDYVEANVDAKLKDLIRRTDVLSEFLPWDHAPPANSATSPLLAVQITTFCCQGFVLGLQISHVIADAFSMMAFVKEWARASSNKSINSDICDLLSYYDNNVVSIFPAKTLPACLIFPAPELSFVDAVTVTRTFLFGESVISNIKSRKSGSSSRVVVVLALIWRALNAVSMAKHERFQGSTLVLTMNLRGKCRPDLPISELCCGNFWIPVLVRAKMEDQKIEFEFELEELMMLLQHTIKSTSEKISQASAEEISSLVMSSWKAVFEERCNDVDVLMCTSWCRLDMYEADFGWGKPCWVSPENNVEGVVLMDAESGNGIEACLCLNPKDMIDFKSQLQNSLPESSNLAGFFPTNGR